MDLLQELPVLDPVDCDVLIHISQGVAVDRNVTIYLDDILVSVFRAFDSLDDRYGAVCLVELEEIIYLKKYRNSGTIKPTLKDASLCAAQ
jgi:hypothetical protein